jgi:hypothetical protein
LGAPFFCDNLNLGVYVVLKKLGQDPDFFISCEKFFPKPNLDHPTSIVWMAFVIYTRVLLSLAAQKQN